MVWNPDSTPVPWGALAAFVHNATELDSRAGVPPTVTRLAGAIHCTATHGDGEPEMLNEQPAIVTVSVLTSAGLPPSSTFWLDGAATPWPPWGQAIWVAASEQEGHYVTSRAPSLIETEELVSATFCPPNSIEMPLWSSVTLAPETAVTSIDSLPAASFSSTL